MMIRLAVMEWLPRRGGRRWVMRDGANDIIMVVDDDPGVLRSLAIILGNYYDVVSCMSAKQALDSFHPDKITIVLSDVKMPSMSGLELLDRLRNISKDVPVILMTAHAETEYMVGAVRKKAFDFIIKPFKPEALISAVELAVRSRKETELERVRQRMLEESIQEKSERLEMMLDLIRDISMETVQHLSVAAECRDNETGSHICRIGKYSECLAEALGMERAYVKAIALTSQMHDIGKIGISDNILLKRGSLSGREFEIMKTHTIIGGRILSGSRNPSVRMASKIALHHHERWDGSGYPEGLSGEDIPVEGRIVFICDQYDALRSKRPYKPPFSHEQAFDIITKGDGRTMPGHFDPGLLTLFRENAELFDRIFEIHRPEEENFY
jgi:putative two-component system response regulator